MHISGTFYNQRDQKVAVDIVTHGDKTEQLEIGTEESGIYFTDDPVEITSQVNDTFDVLLCYQASVRLLCRDYIPDFFCNSCREAVVNISVDDKCLFAGFIEPQAFSQGYNEAMDEVELTCIDRLSALQYSNYRGIGSSGVSYAIVKSKAEQRTFLDILSEILAGVADCTEDDVLDLILYDGSKSVDDGEGLGRYQVFQSISISELLFLGDEEDDVWTQEDVLTEMLKYLGLHIVQDGDKFYIFSWESIKGTLIPFRRLSSTTSSSSRITVYTKKITTDMVADCDTQLSVCPTYNQLLLTDNVTEVDNVIESPLDSDSLIVAGNYQKYMTEYVSLGKQDSSHIYGTIRSFLRMIMNDTTGGDYEHIYDWYAWPKGVKNWTFQSGKKTRVNLYDTYPVNGSNQQDILNKGLASGIGACVCAFGKLERKNDRTEVVTHVDMEDYLVISVMGNKEETAAYPQEGDLQTSCPVAEYDGNVSGGTFSPSDEVTTNYIVISGKMQLSPTMKTSNTYVELKKRTDASGDKVDIGDKRSMNSVYGKEKWMYNARRYWKASLWKDEPENDDYANALEYTDAFYPISEYALQNYEYHYSAAGSETDTIKKLGLVACMLIIGDKCVVEKLKGEDLGTGVPGTGEGEPEDYVWMDFKERSECANDDEYYQQCFTIGVNPAIGDCIIGKEFEIQKNAPYTRGITAEGTAIPIKMADKVSGKVQFKILGPVNAEWNNITRRHKTWFRRTKWYQNSVALLQEVSAIFLKDFKVEVVSDNGKMGAVSDDSDIVYMSDTAETFVNKKDDLEFKITTALTSEECKAMGVNNAVKLSSPENVAQKNALLSIYDWNKKETAKPEQLYVDSYWQEWHEPRVELTQNLIDSSGYVSLFSRFSVPSIGKKFFVEGISRNLTEGTAQVTMKEIW